MARALAVAPSVVVWTLCALVLASVVGKVAGGAGAAEHHHDHDAEHHHDSHHNDAGHHDHHDDHDHDHDHDHGHDSGGHAAKSVDAGSHHEHAHDHAHEHEDAHGHGHGHDHGHRHGHGDAHGHDRRAKVDWFGAYMSALAMSAISFAGIVLLIFLKMPRIEPVVEYACLFFAGTVLVADALIHLLPHALEGADHETMTYVGVSAVLGCMSIMIIPEVLEWHHGCEHKHHVEAYGVANLVTEMLHNFVDGISLGLAWMAGTPAGLSAAVAVAVHELPQELGDFVVLRSAGFGTARLLFWNVLVSLTCLLGVVVVHFLGETAEAMAVKRYVTAFTAGSFLSLSLNMIFPQVSESIKKRHGTSGSKRAKLLCAVLGVLAVWALIAIGQLEEGHHGHDHGHGDSHGHGHLHGHGHGHSHGHAHGHGHGHEL